MIFSVAGVTRQFESPRLSGRATITPRAESARRVRTCDTRGPTRNPHIAPDLPKLGGSGAFVVSPRGHLRNPLAYADDLA